MARDGRRGVTLPQVLLAAAAVAAVAWLAWPRPPRRAYPGRIPVRFWHMWTAESEQVVERIVDRFNRSQDRYEVIPLSIPSRGADTKFLLSVVGGDPPDCMAEW